MLFPKRAGVLTLRHVLSTTMRRASLSAMRTLPVRALLSAVRRPVLYSPDATPLLDPPHPISGILVITGKYSSLNYLA